MASFVKIHSHILESSVWLQDASTRLVWVTMLVMADQHGEVVASVPGLADRAKVPLDDCMRALEILSGPDPHSRTKDFDGARIDVIDGGWCILNYKKYRNLGSIDDKRSKNAKRQARWRERHRNASVTPSNAPVTPSNANLTEAEAEAEAEAVNTSTNPNGTEQARRGGAGLGHETQRIDAVIGHYKTYHPKSRPGADIRRKIGRRLAEGYTVADLCQAIDGNHVDPHCCGVNDNGRKYHNLELIVRNSSKVDQYLAAWDARNEPQLTPASKRSLMAGAKAALGGPNIFDPQADLSRTFLGPVIESVEHAKQQRDSLAHHVDAKGISSGSGPADGARLLGSDQGLRPDQDTPGDRRNSDA